MKTDITFSIVGCGRIAERHAQNMKEVGRLISVCDIKSDRATAFANAYGVRAYTSLEDMLSAKDLGEVFAICTPSGLHKMHTIQALKAKRHVICEKPMALSVRDCQEMILTAEKVGKRLFIVKQNRFNPPVVEVKRLIEDGRLGKILSIHVSCFWNRQDVYYHESDWKGTKSLDGGVLFNQFSHFIDLLYWMFGEVKKTKSIIKNSQHRTIEIDDNGGVLLEFEDGIVGTIHFTTNSYAKNMEGSITIFGEKGTVKIGGQYLNVLEYACVEGYTPATLPPSNNANDYGTYVGSMANHDKVYQNVVDVLTRGLTLTTSGMEGLKTVELIQRIYDVAD